MNVYLGRVFCVEYSVPATTGATWILTALTGWPARYAPTANWLVLFRNGAGVNPASSGGVFRAGSSGSCVKSNNWSAPAAPAMPKLMAANATRKNFVALEVDLVFLTI